MGDTVALLLPGNAAAMAGFFLALRKFCLVFAWNWKMDLSITRCSKDNQRIGKKRHFCIFNTPPNTRGDYRGVI